MKNSLLLQKAVKACSLKQLSLYLLTGREIVMLPKNFFNDFVKTADDIVKYLSLTKKFTDTMLVNEAGIPVNVNNINKILLDKLPRKIRLTVPYNKKGQKSYKAWVAKLLTLQNFLFDKTEECFEIEVHDKDFYSAGIIDIETIKYLKFTPKKKVIVETCEKQYVLGNELGIRETYNIDGKVVYAKSLIQKLHFDWCIDGVVFRLNEYNRSIDNYCDRIIEQEEAEYVEAPDFFNDIPLSAYQMLCKMCNNIDKKIMDWLVNKINKAFGYAFKDIEDFLDFIDAKRAKKLDKDLYFLDNRGLIELIKTMYREAPTESLDDEYFGNSIYFEDTAFDVASDITDNTEDED